MTDQSYIHFSHCNLWQSPNAAAELGLYLNKSMNHYRYIDKDRAGFFLDNDLRDTQDENYKARMGNVGIRLDQDGNIAERPSEEERIKYKASYKKAQAKLGQQNKDNNVGGLNVASQAISATVI